MQVKVKGTRLWFDEDFDGSIIRISPRPRAVYGDGFWRLMGVLPDARAAVESDPSTMIRAADDYWDSDRASYEDDLNAWRERTAAPVAVAEVPATRSEARRPVRRPIAVAAGRPHLRRSRPAPRRATLPALAR